MKIQRILAALWLALFIAGPCYWLWEYLEKSAPAYNGIHALLSPLCLFGVIASIFLFKGAKWARLSLGIIALFFGAGALWDIWQGGWMRADKWADDSLFVFSLGSVVLLFFPRQESFGFRLARELDDCGKDIMAVFGVTDFYHDYEDTWEWVEGAGSGGLHVNISRPHNSEAGEYDIPVLLRVSGPVSVLTREFLSDSGQRLANRLQTEVWIGNVVTNDKSERRYEFAIEQSFTPVA